MAAWLLLVTFGAAHEPYDLFVNEFGENRSWIPILTTEAGGWLFIGYGDAAAHLSITSPSKTSPRDAARLHPGHARYLCCRV